MNELKNFILCYFSGSNIFKKYIFKVFLIRSEIKFINYYCRYAIMVILY